MHLTICHYYIDSINVHTKRIYTKFFLRIGTVDRSTEKT